RLAALEAPDVREGLTFADHARLALIEKDHRGPRGLVVVRRRRDAVRTRGRDREDVPRSCRRQTHRANEQVTGLAVPAGDGDLFGRLLARARGQHGAVLATVDRGADVVTHPAIDGDERP